MENKSGKYMKYAAGEIILVVIGILIALQINNWNEHRKLSNEIQNIFTAFENELEENIESCNSLIRRGYRIDSTLTLYVNNEITQKNIRDHSPALMFSISMRKFIHDNLDDLILHEKQLPDKYLALIPDLKELKRRIESQYQWEKTVFDLRMSRTKEMVDELPFYNLRDSISRVKLINHILTSPSHKNKIIHYYQNELTENIWDATLIRTSSLALLWKIKTAKEELDIPLEAFLNSFGLKPFQEINCNERPFKIQEKINFRRNFILYNNSNDTISYNYLNSKGEVLKQQRLLRMPPKSFILNEITIGVNEFIEIIKNDNCNKVYRRINEDYLIIK